jgi:AraC-like DNA-binding protein
MREGFPGQRTYVVPPAVVRSVQTQPMLASLTVTAAGHFPHAAGHYVDRPDGIADMVLLYCTRGNGWIRIRNRIHPLTENTVACLPPQEPHWYGAAGTETSESDDVDDLPAWTIYWFHARGKSIPELLSLLDVSDDRPLFAVVPDAPLATLFEELIEQVHEGYGPRQLRASSFCAGYLVKAMLDAQRAATSRMSGPEERVRETIAFMRSQLRRKGLRISALAAIAHLSLSHYSAMFKRLTGYAPIDYFIRLKMQRACGLLDSTRLPIGVVAAEVGYADSHYFSRQFARVIGESPRSYRAATKG